MLNIIETSINEVNLGDPQHYRNMTVFPILYSGQSNLEYSILGRALNQGYLRITEISESGSVPELKLINMSESYILLLDGQELEGAKQNRVLNTTLLIYPKSELTVPVSCTEQGRWNRVSAAFQESGKFLFRRARGNKMSSVNQSLRQGQGYRSNQSEVWSDISRLHLRRNTHSPTSAMKDIYDKEKGNLDDFLKAFPTIEGQCGVIVGLGGKVSGLELLSSSDCYTEVHRQLIESYTMDCLVENFSGENLNLSLGEAQRFLEQICSASQETYPSKAAGNDVRLESEHIIGSGLIEGKELIHLSVFSRQSESQRFSPRMASYSHRRRNRQI